MIANKCVDSPLGNFSMRRITQNRIIHIIVRIYVSNLKVIRIRKLVASGM